MTTPPKIALIGRTNVGKSSLFNRMVEEQKSLVSDIAGTTRDRFEADCVWRAEVMRLIDTGGLNVDRVDEVERNIIEQATIAIEQADLIFFVVDMSVGPTADDREIAKILFAKKKPVLVVGNKADTAGLRKKADSDEWKNWALPRPLTVSARQGTGVGDILDAAREQLIAIGKPPCNVQDVATMRVAVLGEPNVGKSTLLNALLGEKRFITANAAHTTREPNDASLNRDGKQYLFIDTAGIRKASSIRNSGTRLEAQGVERTLLILERTDVALFVLDVKKGITSQDKHLAGVLADAGVSVIIVLNKWDLVENKTTTTINEVEKYIRGLLPQLKYAPVAIASALTGQHTNKLFDLINNTFQSRFTQLSDVETKAFISQAITKHRPSRGKGVKHPRIIKFVQSSVNPPTFLLAVNLSRKDSLADSYLRFLENLLRDRYSFVGTPIRMRVAASRKSHTTYGD
jgi:GTPase